MIRTGLPAILALSLVTLGGCRDWSPSVDVHPSLSMNGKPMAGDAAGQYEIGKRALAEQRFAFAAQSFQAAVLIEPTIERLNALAIAYDHLGRYDLSNSYFKMALDRDIRNVQTLNNFGVSLARRGLTDQAAVFFAQAKQDAPEDGIIAANLILAGTVPSPVENQGQELAAVMPALEPKPLPRIERVGMREQQLITRVTPASLTRAEVLPLPSVFHYVPRQLAIEVASVEPTPAAPQAESGEVTVAVVSQPAEAQGASKSRPAKPAPRVEVSNGAGRTQMGARMRAFLVPQGVRVASLTNDRKFNHLTTVIFYRPEYEAAARELAQALPASVTLMASTSHVGDIRLRLGRDLVQFDEVLQRAESHHAV